MRCPAEQKAETHEKILATAARSFREHGSERNGIGQVRKELELTKGGFYRHFDSKGDLYAAALARAFEELGNRMIAVAEAALAPEIARQPLEIRKRINQSMLALRERLLPYIPGSTVEEKRGRFFVLFPGMAGVLVTARAIADLHGRERMLADARSFYLEAFGSKKG